MVVDIDQLTNFVAALSSQPNFIRHVIIGLLAIFVSFVVLEMQHQLQNPSLQGNSASSGIIGFLFRLFVQPILTAVATLFTAVWTLILRILGTALGVGFGLGLAGHIYESLDDMHKHADVKEKRRSTTVAGKIPASPYAISDDTNSYHSLMKSAGYTTDNAILRAQIVRGESAVLASRANGSRSGQNSVLNDTQRRQSIYKFDAGDMASTRMKSMWPNLSPLINESLAKLTEFVLRDYVSSWYEKVDENVHFNSPVSTFQDNKSDEPFGIQNETRFEKQERRTTVGDPLEITSLQDTTSAPSLSSHSRPPPSPYLSKSMSISSGENDDSQKQTQNRTMVLTKTGTLPSPFIDSLYTSFAYLLGTLATRASENVNVFELLLFRLPNVLGKNLKVYRELKNLALEKKRRREGGDSVRHGSRKEKPTNGATIASSISQSSCNSRADEDEVSEIAIVREYLLAGRFHKALTFGLDVPSLLFADPLAKDCPPSVSYKEIEERLKFQEDSVLEDRILSTCSTLVAECELDYNRVMAAKVSKLIVQKNEIDSSTVRTMLVEMLAACVLMPFMGCFIPDSVNGWIITGLQLLLEEREVDNISAETDDAATSLMTRSESVASFDEANRSMFSFSETNHINHSRVDCDDDIDDILDTVLGDNTSDVLGDGSITSELDESLFESTEDASKLCDPSDELASCMKSEQLITLLSMSIIELRNFVDFDDCRYAKEHNHDIPVNWDNHRVREAIRHLVLVVEAALLLGLRPERKRFAVKCDSLNHISEMIEATLDEEDTTNGDDFDVDIDVVSESKVPLTSLHQHGSISTILMEFTGDIDTYEKAIHDTESNQVESADDDSVEDIEMVFTPKPFELSTLRTLIAAWLHAGQAFRVLSIIGRSHETILKPFYYKNSFMRRGNYISEFIKLMKQLDKVEISVDTTAVLASQCLLMTGGGLDNFERQLLDTVDTESAPKASASRENDLDVFRSGRFKQGGLRAHFVQNRLTRFAQSASESFNFGKVDVDDPDQSAQKYNQHSQGTPAYLQFNMNMKLASSLRTERQRRMNSWQKETSDKEKLEMVCRSKGSSEKDELLQRELHHLARFFYSNTNEIMIEPCSTGGTTSISESAANVTVKAIAPRRKIEVPDEDSSFLLRAQPRALKPVAIHRDQHQANLACKIYVAMFEEPAIHPKTLRYNGGRYLRQCLFKYYPNDKTASVSIANDLTVLDRRVGQPSVMHILPKEFQNTRHMCLKVANQQSLLASPLMEPNDFNACPRPGKAVDFVYRQSFFDKPVVDLSGKKFRIYDASALLQHRANASSLELSDAALTAAIIIRGSSGINVCNDQQNNSRSFNIEISDNGSPLVLLRASVPGREKEEARPYRPSFLRAALLLKSSRQEAQNQCLSYCIKNGSARSSSKIKSDNWLQPALNLLHYANSRRQEEQFLLRDLQLGMNHIDRAQLCRNGMLNPRYPTVLRGLTVKVTDVVEVNAPSNMDLLGAPTLMLFRIRCTAITELIGEENDAENAYGDESNSKSRYFREEWTVSRSLREFAVFHKHIKSQVAPTEHSASTGAKLVGAATAALTIVGGSHVVVKKERGPLVPSLTKATQVGTLGLSSKRANEKRKTLLDEYLKYLTAPSNLLSRCPELLKFLGAYTSIFGNNGMDYDEFGREDATKVELDTDKLKAGIVHVKPQTEQRRLDATPKKTNKRASTMTHRASYNPNDETPNESDKSLSACTPKNVDEKQMNITKRIAMKRSREINLRDVRRSAFRLLRDVFDLDNASFFRSRVISVIKTMSLAFTSVQDFHLMLFRSHVKYMNGEWVSGWIFYLIDMFWPNGVFYTKGPDLTEKEQLDLKNNSKKILERALPLQLKTVLGRHSDEGLDLLHEMLQNRLVLKSIAYMLLDSVWAEVFPELADFTTGVECLEKDL